MKFRTKLLSAGKTATGFEVPAKVVAGLGESKRPPVRVTINGYTYRSTVAVYGGTFMIGVSAEHREGAGVKGGDMLDVELQLDTAPRVVVVPADLKRALAGDPKAKAHFDGLSYSRKNAIVLNVEGTKVAETRARRIEKAVANLRAGKG